MTTLIKTLVMAGLIALISGCAYDPAYSYNSSGSYYGSGYGNRPYYGYNGGSGYGNRPYYGNSGYNNGYQAGYYSPGSNYGYYNRGGYNGRYCPDDDD